jgi:hypothetical protein
MDVRSALQFDRVSFPLRSTLLQRQPGTRAGAASAPEQCPRGTAMCRLPQGFGPPFAPVRVERAGGKSLGLISSFIASPLHHDPQPLLEGCIAGLYNERGPASWEAAIRLRPDKCKATRANDKSRPNQDHLHTRYSRFPLPHGCHPAH